MVQRTIASWPVVITTAIQWGDIQDLLKPIQTLISTDLWEENAAYCQTERGTLKGSLDQPDALAGLSHYIVI